MKRRRHPRGGGPGPGSPHGFYHTHATDRPTTAKEIQIAYPKTFNGKPKNLRKFLQDVTLYLQINEGTYDTDEKKIGFVLSLLDGDALVWKEQFLNRQRAPFDQGFMLGTYSDYVQDMRNDFKDTDSKADALYELRSIQQGSNPIEIHNSRFKLLISQGELNAIDNQAVLIDYYC